MARDGGDRKLVVFLTEDTYAQPLVKLAAELIAVPLGAEHEYEPVDRSLFLNERKLRAKLWQVHDRWKDEGLTVIRVDGFVDTEGSPNIPKKTAAVERTINYPGSQAHPLPFPFHLHCLKPNQEGLLLHAPVVISEASEKAMREVSVRSDEEKAATAARKRIRNHRKRPATKPAISKVFGDLFAGQGKSSYMARIASAPGFCSGAFASPPACMSPGALGLGTKP